MTVRVIIPEPFQVAAGGLEEIETHANTVGDCLKEAAALAPPLRKVWFTPEGGLSKYVALYVNCVNVPGNKLTQAVKDGDEIMPLLVIGGG